MKKLREEPEAPAAALVTARPQGEPSMVSLLAEMAQATGAPPMKLMREFASLSFGPGKIAFPDYTRLRLFDDVFWQGVDKRTVVGQRRNRDLDVQINHRHDWYGLCANKVASNAYLSAFGFPVIASAAIYAQDLAAPAQALIRTQGDLRQFLASEAPYPLFGKPVEGIQSLGAVALLDFDAKSATLGAPGGGRLRLDDFVEDLRTNYPGGYLFQRLVEPHESVRRLCGSRLATVRLVTINTDQGPRIFRACWKIPSGDNIADNYWRPGNLLAQLDLRTGAILRVTGGAGLELAEVAKHPDTKAPLVGAKVPDWEAMKATAIEAARVMRPLAMIGWDIAPSSSGPLIVEMNETPDLFLNQLADRRGVLEPEFLEFMAAQKLVAAERSDLMRADVARL